MKVCKICGEKKPLTEFYSQKKYSKKRGHWIYYNPECKQCTIERTEKWQKDNEERYRELCRKKDEIWNKNPDKLKKMRKAAKLQKENGYQKKWQQEHPEKLKEYYYNHMHKEHDITDVEWNACKKYFDYKCAYCGVPEEVAKETQGNYLHMEHTVNKGENDLSNCIPSCRNCNSTKWIRDFDEWYTEENEKFDIERYNKIIKWLESDYKLYIINK